MSCLTKIAAAIANTCTSIPGKGLCVKGWILNRADITWTGGSGTPLVTAGANALTKQAWSITAVKHEMNAGAEAVLADNLPGLFIHRVTIQPYERDEDAIKNIDNMSDVVIILELEGGEKVADLYTEGKFILLGFGSGLHKVSATWKALDNHGIPTYEFATREGEEEKYSRYVFWITDYATTAAALLALETPGV